MSLLHADSFRFSSAEIEAAMDTSPLDSVYTGHLVGSQAGLPGIACRQLAGGLGGPLRAGNNADDQCGVGAGFARPDGCGGALGTLSSDDLRRRGGGKRFPSRRRGRGDSIAPIDLPPDSPPLRAPSQVVSGSRRSRLARARGEAIRILSNTLLAGAARRSINPLLGTGKGGLRLFGDPIQAIESDLTATALVVGGGTTRVVLLAIDLCSVSTLEASQFGPLSLRRSRSPSPTFF